MGVSPLMSLGLMLLGRAAGVSPLMSRAGVGVGVDDGSDAGGGVGVGWLGLGMFNRSIGCQTWTLNIIQIATPAQTANTDPPSRIRLVFRVMRVSLFGPFDRSTPNTASLPTLTHSSAYAGRRRATRNFALRLRGLRWVSSLLAVIGFFVNTSQ